MGSAVAVSVTLGAYTTSSEHQGKTRVMFR
jgi:hypothetical protein